MKGITHKTFYLLITLFTALFYISCDDKKEEDVTLHFDKAFITLDFRPQVNQTLEVSANTSWSISSEIPRWLSVEPMSGNGSLTEVTIMTLEKNQNLEKRETLLLFTNSYGNDKPIKIIQLGLADSDPFIELDDKQLGIDLAGETKKVKLTANRPWEITSIPNWIKVSPTSGDNSTEISITVNENHEMAGKEAILTFKLKEGQIKEQLTLIQPGRQDIIQSPFLEIFRSVSTSISGNGSYRITTNRFFVSSYINNKIYLGSLIHHQANNMPDFYSFTGYTFNPITASANSKSDAKMKTYIPSISEQKNFAQELTANPPRSTATIIYDRFNPTPFWTHRQLRIIGIGNMGINLDELVAEKPYTQEEMTRRYGLIYSFRHTLFSLDMDLPQQLIQEKLKEADKAKGVSYVNSMDYGKIGLLIIETDTKLNDIQSAIKRLMLEDEGYVRQQEDIALVEASDVTYLYFGNNGQMLFNKNKMEALIAYKKALYNKQDKENIYPVNFSLANFEDHTDKPIVFSFEVPR